MRGRAEGYIAWSRRAPLKVAKNHLDPSGCRGVWHPVTEGEVRLDVQDRGAVDDVGASEGKAVALDRYNLGAVERNEEGWNLRRRLARSKVSPLNE